MASSNTIKLRTPTLADIPTIITVIAATFAGDEFYNLSMPGRVAHPDDFHRFLSRKLRTRFASPGYRFQVAHDHSTTPATMVGFTCVKLDGQCRLADDWNSTTADGRSQVGAWVERKLLDVEDWYELYVTGNRAIDYSFQTEAALLEGAFGGFTAMLYQRTLVVLPEWQGRGVGTMMIEWTLDWGRKEGLPVVLNASERGLRVYEKAGFKVVMVEKLRGLEVPNMVWEPEQSKGRWLEKTSDVKMPWRVRKDIEDSSNALSTANVPLADIKI